MQPVEHVKIPPAPPDRDKQTNKNNEHRIHIETVPLNHVDDMNTSSTTNNDTSNTLNSDIPICITPLNSLKQRTTLNRIDIDNEMKLKSTLEPVIRKLMKLKLNVNEQYEAIGMIDSGAACNCINRNYATSNNLAIFECEPYLITLANKTTTTSNELCKLTIELPSVKHRLTIVCIVLPNLSETIILGMPFLENFNPNIDWQTKSISIDIDKVKQTSHEMIDIDNTNNIFRSQNIVLSSFSIETSTQEHRNTNSVPVPVQSKSKSTSKSKPDNESSNQLIKVIPWHQFKRLTKNSSNKFCMIQMMNIEPALNSNQTNSNLELNNIELIDLNNIGIEHTNELTHENNTEQQRTYNEHELQIHSEYKDIFAPIPPGLPPKRTHDHKIELQPNSQPVSKPAYRLATNELDELRKQLDTLIANEHIRPSTSPFGAPVLFVKKKDGTMRMCVDYRGLNNITVKNSYPLPKIDELLNRVSGAKWFSKIDLQQGYHQVRVDEADIYKTAFRTRYGLFAFLVLPFGLCNAPGTFMNLMHDILKPYLDKSCLGFLDDIFIYSKTLNEHRIHVKEILNKLREHRLHVKLSKCEFMKQTIEFLGFRIDQNGIGMMETKVKAILDWPTPRTVKEVRSFLGLSGFYRNFIHMFSDTVASLNDLLKKDLEKFVWTDQHEKDFQSLKRKISAQPTLILPIPTVQYVVQTDASGFAIGATLMQDHGNGLQPVAFLSKKLLPAETRYPTHEQELLAIVIALKEWRHYLYGNKFIVQTDHKSIIYFKTQEHMSPRQIRWSEYLQQFDYEIQYKAGSENVVADALSRRKDHETLNTTNRTSNEHILTMKTNSSKLEPELATQTLTSTSMNNIDIESKEQKSESTLDIPLIIQIKRAYEIDLECKLILNELLNLNDQNENNEHKDNTVTSNSMNLNPEHRNEHILTIEKKYNRYNEYRLNNEGLILKHDRILIPDNEPIRTQIIMSCHDDKTSAHSGVTKTTELVTRTFIWKHLHRHIKEYVNTCVSCQQMKSSNQQPLGLLQPIPTPEQRFHTWTLDFITALPRTKRGHTAITVAMDKTTKTVHYVPTLTESGAPEQAILFFDNVVKLHGLPANIISDRDPRFTSLFWKTLWKKLGTNLSMSTSFHPQSDGQTERQNRTLEQSLRAYTNYHLDDWDDHLPMLELAHNNSVQASTGYSPMFLSTGQHPRMPLDIELKTDMVNGTAEQLIEKLYSTLEYANENILKAQANQSKYANQHRRENATWKLGQLVMLSTSNLRQPGRAQKLLPYWIGPFKIKRVLSNLTYELDLPLNMKIHPVFHVSHLKLAQQSNSFPSRPTSNTKPPAQLLDETKEEVYIVETILKKRLNRNRIEYLVKWEGYPDWESTWEPESAFKQHRDAINKFEQQQRNTTSNSSSTSTNRIQTRSRART